MRLCSGVPGRWTIRLVSGTEIALWADSFQESPDEYVFGNLVEATPLEQTSPDLEITNRTPSDPQRVIVTVARIPASEVADVLTYGE